MPKQSTTPSLSKVLALGFVLGAGATVKEAQAYYAIGWALLGSTTTSVGFGIWGGVLLTNQTVDDLNVSVGDTTRRMVDVALLAMHSDLGMQAELLTTSPVAYRQFSAELSTGSGPSVVAIQQSTGLSTERLREAWNQAEGQHASAVSETEAARIVATFIKVIGPEVAVSNDVASDFAWKLVREESTQNSHTRAWLAEWLGVEQVAIKNACLAAQVELGLVDAANARSLLYEDPNIFLDILSARLESSHAEALQVRLNELTKYSISVDG
jgi:hypothetical protein